MDVKRSLRYTWSKKNHARVPEVNRVTAVNFLEEIVISPVKMLNFKKKPLILNKSRSNIYHFKKNLIIWTTNNKNFYRFIFLFLILVLFFQLFQCNL